METMNVNSMGGGELLGKVEIDTDQVQSAIDELTKHSENLINYLSEINNDVTSRLPAVWIGDDANSFISSMSDLAVLNLVNIQKNINKKIFNLATIKQQYEDLDTTYGAKSISI